MHSTACRKIEVLGHRDRSLWPVTLEWFHRGFRDAQPINPGVDDRCWSESEDHASERSIDTDPKVASHKHCQTFLDVEFGALFHFHEVVVVTERSTPRNDTELQSEQVREGDDRAYSVLRNSATATPIITRPMAATMPNARPTGTSQPPQVMLGARLRTAGPGRLR